MVSTVIRDKKVKALRYLLRRKQCSLVLIVEALLLILLLTLGVTLIWWRDYMHRKRLYVQAQDERLIEYKENITFAHCPLTLVEREEGVDGFALTYCSNRVGRVAFAYRHWRLDEDNNEKTCLSITEQVLCHEHMMDQWKVLTELPASGPKCPGKKSDWNEHTPISRRFVPIQTDLKDQAHKISHSALLIAECPICVKAGAEATSNGNTCEVKLDTKKTGWPWHHEKCSDYSKLYTNVTSLCNTPANSLPTTTTALPTQPTEPTVAAQVKRNADFFDEAY